MRSFGTRATEAPETQQLPADARIVMIGTYFFGGKMSLRDNDAVGDDRPDNQQQF